MKILIDTHIAVWAVLNDPKLPEKAKEMLLDIENDILYSTASIWEITIKHMLHPEKLRMNGNILEEGCEDNGYTALPILNAHVRLPVNRFWGNWQHESKRAGYDRGTGNHGYQTGK